jgi:CheY-like chemotaxis protein
MVHIEFNRLRFLVIDDNAHMRSIVRALLHSFGAREVYEAEDGTSGLDAFMQCTPEIVITDWVMPGLDGLKLTRMMRQPDEHANAYVSIIMLTGHSEKTRVLAQGAVRAHRQRDHQSAPLHPDRNLFRARPPPHRQPEL